MMMNQDIINQTQFASQEPVLENPVVIDTSPKESKKTNKKSKKMLLFVLIAFTAFVFLLLILAILAQNGNGGDVKEETTEEELIEQQAQQDPKQLRLNQLKSSLKSADPAKNELIFPPVDLELELDKQ